MRNQILVRKRIKAYSVNKAMQIIKTKFPYARLITYKFDKDMRYELKKDYKNRTISVAFIRDFRPIKEELA